MDALEDFKRELAHHHQETLAFLQQAEHFASKSGNTELLHFIEKEKNKVEQRLSQIQERSEELNPIVQKAVHIRTKDLEKQIEVLHKTKEALRSDNLFLEYKKKDLLNLATALEETNEDITTRNAELVRQQQTITQQSLELHAIHQEILEKHKELELQKEALQDQSDYLHEANQTITMMHEEVQQQKNEILKKNEELLNLNNEKNNLISIVAHDLKSPLNQMRGLLSIVKVKIDNRDAETTACLDMIEKSATRLTALIAKILDVEAIESKDLNLVLERFNLTETFKILIERYALAAAAKDIKLIADFDDAILVLADKVYTMQIFDNLLSNAIKFSPANKSIWIRVLKEKDGIVTEVKDEGPGISEADMKKLFGKYQKLSAKPTGNESSTGLGLSIVKKFVEAMNGRIWCESEFGNGASFFVQLPK
ncbi:MAG TPA: ATP-binding protein [Chryseosolibacter sp.]